MGDPRKHRRKYARPKHLWKEERLVEETGLCKKYGLTNRKEIWRVKHTADNFRKQARKLLTASDEEASKKLLGRLNRLGIPDMTSLESVLRLSTEDLLERRLQTMIYKKGIVNTINQARQFVIHGHVMVGNSVVGVPSYMVTKNQEEKIRLKEEIRKNLIISEKKPPKANREGTVGGVTAGARKKPWRRGGRR
ncbi:MAG: 30S ribosomal protein S4 [Candidatus Altiarchaeales archaeon]|nr:30S ribosomal protein S4 [Candidatus Altiarchaeales archaeon]